MCGDLVNECGIKVELDLAQVSELSQERYRLAAELEALQGVGPPPPPPQLSSQGFFHGHLTACWFPASWFPPPAGPPRGNMHGDELVVFAVAGHRLAVAAAAAAAYYSA